MHMFVSDVDNENAQLTPFVLYMYALSVLEGVFILIELKISSYTEGDECLQWVSNQSLKEKNTVKKHHVLWQ
ncbi:hypothetical protein [Lysinibacillus sp. Y5S-8]|uniref:hypothetical protein n=1 Tax=Lysinibacillus sp. Y5S-8 TaxID=3122488 RepID=UPI0030CCDF02